MINKAIIIGHLGSDPEQRFTQSGAAMANFSVATTERWKDKDGQQQEQTEWHRIIAWRRLAEICCEYLHKGSRVYIEGKLQTRKWQDQNGNDRYTTEIVAREMKMLSARGEGGGGGYGGDPGPAEPPSGYGDSQDSNSYGTDGGDSYDGGTSAGGTPAGSTSASGTPSGEGSTSGGEATGGGSSTGSDVPF